MTKAESAILEARDPAAYIEASLKARLAPAGKARLARIWMEKTGYGKDDILHARNRHPYWKKKKMEGSAERTRSRLSAHDYSRGGSIDWTADKVSRFLELNGTDREGRYEHRDWEIAESFGASIPSIQYMRRKYRRALEMLGERAPRSRLVEYLGYAESVLQKGRSAVEELRIERAKGARAGKAREATKAKAVAGKASSGKLPSGKASSGKPGVRKTGKKTATKKTAAKKPAPKNPAKPGLGSGRVSSRTRLAAKESRLPAGKKAAARKSAR